MSKPKSGLGRGLDSLIALSGNLPPAEQDNRLTHIPITQIRPSRYQARTQFDDDSLQELADSIKAQGIIQPITVREYGLDNYELIAGERRLRAAQLAGLAEVPVVIKHINDKTAMAMGLIENIQRENLNPIEEAQGLRRLIDEFELTHEAIAQAIGRSRSTITNSLRLLKLPEPIQDMRAQQKDKTVVMGDYQFLFQTPVPLKPGTAVMNNDLSFVTRDNREVLKRLDKINKLPQEERRFHREELSYLHAYTNLPGNGYLKNAYKAPAIDQNLKLTNDTLAATAGVVGAAALAETAPAQMAMAGYGGWQIGDGSRDIYQGKYKEGTKKLFWGGLDVASVGVSRWTRAGKLGSKP